MTYELTIEVFGSLPIARGLFAATEISTGYGSPVTRPQGLRGQKIDRSCGSVAWAVAGYKLACTTCFLGHKPRVVRRTSAALSSPFVRRTATAGRAPRLRSCLSFAWRSLVWCCSMAQRPRARARSWLRPAARSLTPSTNRRLRAARRTSRTKTSRFVLPRADNGRGAERSGRERLTSGQLRPDGDVLAEALRWSSHVRSVRHPLQQPEHEVHRRHNQRKDGRGSVRVHLLLLGW